MVRMFDNVNHHFQRDAVGARDGYDRLPVQALSQEVLAALGDWLGETLAAERGQPPARRAVAVTVDDLPATRIRTTAEARSLTDRLLAKIRARGLPAVGFVNEQKLSQPGEEAARAELLAAWLDAGLELGNHTYSHRRLYDTPLAEFKDDVLRGERVTKALMEVRGQRERYFRHPMLNTGPTLETKEQFERFLAAHGYEVAPVTIDNDEYLYALAYDAARDRGDSKQMERVATDYVRYMAETFTYYETLSDTLFGRQPAQVLLLHANNLNADHLGTLLDMIARRGYIFISLEQALRDPAYGHADRFVGPRGPSWLVRWAITEDRAPAEPPAVADWVRPR
jgi:peptidoglycan/xylan/chitin deacetylase (PgdA/CDA1 family)